MSAATMTMTASPAKLKSGAWGARVRGTASVGDIVTITTAAGKSWRAKITRIAWTGDGITLAETASMDRAPSASAAPRSTSRYGGRSDSGSCQACEWNEDSGDMNGCARHRGNPR